MNTLTPPQKKHLKSLAQALKPVVMIGAQGLTDAVIAETQRALAAHELIKVRVLGDDRETRITWYESLCETTGAHAVQHIGKLLVLYKPAETPRIKFEK
jgi:RNA-binding protein